MTRFGASEETPVQGLILHIVFAKSQRRDRLGHFVAEIKSMARIDRFVLRHLREQIKGIAAAKMHLVVDDVNQAALGEQTKIWVADVLSQFGQERLAMFAELGVAEQDQVRLQVLG